MNCLLEKTDVVSPVPKKRHAVLALLRYTGIVVLALLLTVGLVFTVAVVSARVGLVPERVYALAEGLEYAEIPVLLEGETVSLISALQIIFKSLGIPLTNATVLQILEQLSVPEICASLCRDMAAWFWKSAPAPTVDPVGMAELILSRVDAGIGNILAIVSGGDPVGLVAYLLETPLSNLHLDALYSRLEPLRTYFSIDSLSILISACGILALLLYLFCGSSLCRLTAPLAGAFLFTGIASAGMAVFLRIGLFRAAPGYGTYLFTLFSGVYRMLWQCAVICGGIGFLLAVIWLVFFFWSRQKTSERAEITDADIPPILP